MISDKRVIDSLSSRWRGPSFWSPAVGRRGGVAILFSSGLQDNLSVWKKDTEGRVLSVLLNFDSQSINLVNLYAPTVPADRRVFYQSVHLYFFPHSSFIVGGDFNCYDGSSDKFGGTVSISSDLSDLKWSFLLRDAWRALHPRTRQFTWFNSDSSVASRLDTFLVARSLLPSVKSCVISPCVFSDHEFVFIDLVLDVSSKYGPGVWKLNNSLLEDESYCEKIRSLIDRFLLFKHVFSSSGSFWESLKNDIKVESIAFSKQKRRDLSDRRVSLTNRLIALKHRLVSGDSSVKLEIADLEGSLKVLMTEEYVGEN